MSSGRRGLGRGRPRRDPGADPELRRRVRHAQRHGPHVPPAVVRVAGRRQGRGPARPTRPRRPRPVTAAGRASTRRRQRASTAPARLLGGDRSRHLGGIGDVSHPFGLLPALADHVAHHQCQLDGQYRQSRRAAAVDARGARARGGADRDRRLRAGGRTPRAERRTSTRSESGRRVHRD